MAIKTYSLAREGTKRLIDNFQVREFACQDGSDNVVVDDALVIALQKLRDHFQAVVVIHSAYRTAAHNAKIGGSPNSQHLYGRAADLHVAGVPHLAVAQYVESIGMAGIGLYPWGVHVDTRAGKSCWQEVKGKLVNVATFGGQKKEDAGMAVVESRKMVVDGAPKQIRAILDKGENYVHLRDFVSALGGAVCYNEAAKLIYIESGK